MTGRRDDNLSRSEGRMVGRFEMFGAIASSGFASVHLGRTTGGPSKLVAIHHVYPQLVEDPEIARIFLDEARVIAGVEHPNLVPVLDLVEQEGELFVVMDYVEGIALSQVLRIAAQTQERIPLDVVLRVLVGVLHGLHAVHEAQDERGRSLGLIHRDVSPDNVLVGVDGHARVIGFSGARVLGRYQAARDGRDKATLGQTTPEQVMGEPLTRRADVFSASVLMWECLTGRRLFEGGSMGELALKVTRQVIVPPSTFNRTLPRKYDDIIMKGLERDPSMRWETAERMADAIESVGKPASTGRVGKWVKSIAADHLALRSETVSALALPAAEGGERADSDDKGSASEGEDSFKAVATQVLRVRKRSSPVTSEGTEILEVSAPAQPPTAPETTAPVTKRRPPDESRPRAVAAPAAAARPSAPRATERRRDPTEDASPRQEVAPVERRELQAPPAAPRTATARAGARRSEGGLAAEAAHQALEVGSRAHEEQPPAPRSRVAAGLGVVLVGAALVGTFLLVASEREPEPAAPSDAPVVTSAPPPEAAVAEQTPPEEERGEPPAEEPVTEAPRPSATTKDVPSPAPPARPPPRSWARPLPRPAPPPKAPAPKPSDSLFERE